MTRAQRKLDHIQHAITTGQSRKSGFDEMKFVHQSLPNTAVNDIEIDTQIGELNLSSPIFINAMTGGGGTETEKINAQLAAAARDMGLLMAVGSQMSAIKNHEERDTFRVVRKVNPAGLIMGNLGSEATIEQAEAAAEMIQADALQIHLNVIQELAMPEGDRDFKGALERIQAIAEALPIPVIVKETGFGIGKETAEKLAELPIAGLDISGYGGTNFAAIENARSTRSLDYFNDWGIPTVAALIETIHAAPDKSVIASGGITNSLDVIKSIALGAGACGMAGRLLKVLLERGAEELMTEIDDLHTDMKMMMCALGAAKLDELQDVPVIFYGDIYHWLDVRGYQPREYSQRGKKRF
ncbi:type 2 isopentenyl-diphosphate Delta-isomerase [Bacillus ectoiniformans]|uniref:type 2 isopentenyl-diphosphate Delta-isomerase n=1 Tax=Bacillus ectoiniformans TaxID=1494429 RepID=UPI0019597F4A|nr:type 2 isopentenyl-diphosphate Delta-isomerase [Bacillus ectoiniformans]